MNQDTDPLEAWKRKHGISSAIPQNEDEQRMLKEEQQSTAKAWCCECDALLPIKQMRLITRRIDPYRQIQENSGEYIRKPNRIRMCPACFAECYPNHVKPA